MILHCPTNDASKFVYIFVLASATVGSLDEIVICRLKAFICSNSIYRYISSANNFSGHLLVLLISLEDVHTLAPQLVNSGIAPECFSNGMQHNAFSIEIEWNWTCQAPLSTHRLMWLQLNSISKHTHILYNTYVNIQIYILCAYPEMKSQLQNVISKSVSVSKNANVTIVTFLLHYISN